MCLVLIAVAALGVVLPRQSAAEERPKLAVLDLRGKGVPDELVSSLSDVVTTSLTRLGVFDVVSRADIQRMLEFEQDKQLLGCESDTSCLAEIGGALGVALLVSGSVGQVGSTYIVNLTLTDTAAVNVRAREQREVASRDQLIGEVEGAARFLVRELLAGEQGYIVLNASESGADVEIDGRIVGVTPVPRQTLAGGPHRVKIVKTGFVTWARDIDVRKDQTEVVDASLVPSLEYIEKYDSSAGTWRMMAYLTGGVGVAAIGFGVGGWMWNGSRADELESDVIAAGCQRGADAAATGDCDALQSRRDTIERFDLIAQIVGWTGVAAFATGALLFFLGPEPGIYDQYKPVSIGLTPLPDGIAASGRWQF
jgi:hypothetical protein